MRILILTQWFDPEPTIHGLAFAQSLKDAGHEVQVITGFPNYPGGTVYPGYRIRPWRAEVLDGISVTRVALYPSHDRSAVCRALNYLSFAVSATVAGIVTRFKPDVMYVYHPPLTVGLAAMVIEAARGIPFVYDIQDLWPDSLAATGMVGNSRVLQMVGTCADLVHRQATMVIAQSPGMAQRLARRGVDRERIRMIYNWCDEGALSAAAGSPAAVARTGDFSVVFAGNMGSAQDLSAAIDAARLVQDRPERIRFVFVGDGTDLSALKRRATEIGATNVAFIPRVGMKQMPAILQDADALLVHLKDSPLFAITVPSKIQAYLFAGKPIIAAVHGDAAALVLQANAGVAAKPGDPQSIADAAVHLAQLSPGERAAMGARGRQFYDDSLSLRAGTNAVLDVLKTAVKRSRGTKP